MSKLWAFCFLFSSYFRRYRKFQVFLIYGLLKDAVKIDAADYGLAAFAVFFLFRNSRHAFFQKPQAVGEAPDPAFRQQTDGTFQRKEGNADYPGAVLFLPAERKGRKGFISVQPKGEL